MKKLIMLLAVCSAAVAFGAASHRVNTDQEIALAHQRKLDRELARKMQAKEWGGRYQAKVKYTDMRAIHSSQLPPLD